MKVPATAQLTSAVSALQTFVAKRGESGQQKLFGQDDQMAVLQFTLREIPPRALHKPSRIKLPKPFYPNSEVCVLVKDDVADARKRNHHKKQKLWKNMIKAAGIKGVKKVISLEKLKSEFKSFDDKRKLAQSFDLFLCDQKIIEAMPRELGSVFYKKKHKIPVPVKICQPQEASISSGFDMEEESVATDVKNCTKDLEEAIQGTFMTLPSGPIVGVRVGRCDLPSSDLVANIDTVLRASQSQLKFLTQKAYGRISGGKANEESVKMMEIKSVHLTATDCISLPLFQAEDDERELEVRKTLDLDGVDVRAEKKKAKKEAAPKNEEKAREALNKILSDAKQGKVGGVKKAGKKADSDSEEMKVKKTGAKKKMPLLKGTAKKTKKAV